MWQQKFRLLLVASIVAGVGFGLIASIVEPPLAIELPLFIGLVVGSGLICGLYYYKMCQTGEYDERSEEIELRANRASYATLLIALSAVVAFDLFADVTPYIGTVLVVLLLGGITVDELYIEWYRRKL